MRLIAFVACSVALLSPSLAQAWGYEGHEIIADIARSQLKPAVKAKVDILLLTDTSSLTAHDMTSESTWADAYRAYGHRETAPWRFVDDELDHPDLRAACFGYPAPDRPASAGPAEDCIVDKISEFRAELADPATPAPERLLALKYVLHFIGDVHQPLHASDNHDRGGNCIPVAHGGPRTTNLHAYWDTGATEAMGSDPEQIADELEAQITPSDRRAWAKGDARDWALDSYRVAKADVYTLATSPGCDQDCAPITLSAA